MVLRMDLAPSRRLPGWSTSVGGRSRRTLAVMRGASADPDRTNSSRRGADEDSARRRPANSAARGCRGSCGGGMERAGRKASRASFRVFHCPKATFKMSSRSEADEPAVGALRSAAEQDTDQNFRCVDSVGWRSVERNRDQHLHSRWAEEQVQFCVLDRSHLRAYRVGLPREHRIMVLFLDGGEGSERRSNRRNSIVPRKSLEVVVQRRNVVRQRLRVAVLEHPASEELEDRPAEVVGIVVVGGAEPPPLHHLTGISSAGAWLQAARGIHCSDTLAANRLVELRRAPGRRWHESRDCQTSVQWSDSRRNHRSRLGT